VCSLPLSAFIVSEWVQNTTISPVETLYNNKKAMFRRSNAKTTSGSVSGTDIEGSTTSFSSYTDGRLQEKAQDVMKDNLELMKDIVMKIREDPEFARNIYSNCPRLQYLLNQYPDLRPIFEDPKLVRLNFEQVYRDAGGVLPEDEGKSKKTSWLVWLVNSPIFKVLRLVLFVKKMVMCVVGGGFAFVSGCFLGCCCEDAFEELDEDADADVDGGADPTQEALNKAAEHMEDPEVQEQMQRLLEDPENLQEAIENDEELRALRDSNPLCAELMSDPETMRVLTDPDNLRALGEAPSLIEADFSDPNSFSPDIDVDIEAAGADDLNVADGGDGDFDTGGDDSNGGFDEADGDDEAEGDGDDDDDDDEDAWWDDAELEEQDVDNDNNANKEGGTNARSQARSQARQQQQSDSEGNGMRGIMASIGVAATDILAAQIVGNIFGVDSLPGDLGGGGGGLEVNDGIGEAVDDAGYVINDDVAKVVEDTHEEVNNTANNSKNLQGSLDLDTGTDDDGKRYVGAAAGGVAGVAIVGGTAAIVASRSVNDGKGDEEVGDGFDDEKETEEGPKKKNAFFHAIKKLGTAVAIASKEHLATTLLGDDFGEDLVERMEKKDDDHKDDKRTGGDENLGEDVEEGKSKLRGVFGRQ
jgi:hypothetical protein